MTKKEAHKKWLEWRNLGIGSSDAPIVMGVSPWKTLFQLWEEKTFGKTEQSENSSMKRGKEMEETARKEFEKQMNVSVFPRNIVHEKFSWLRASLDGMDPEEKIIVEIKCPNKQDHFDALTKKVPTKYFPQCQHQLLVTGLSQMYYFSFDGKEGVAVEVLADENYIEELFQKEKKFWEMVTSKEAPPLTEKDIERLENDTEWNPLRR